MQQHAEIEHDDGGDEDPEQEQEFALRDQVGLAGFVDQLGHFAHGAVNRQILQAHVDRHAESQAENAEENAPEQQLVAVDLGAEKIHLRKIGQLEVGFAAGGFLRGAGERRGAHQSESDSAERRKDPSETARARACHSRPSRSGAHNSAAHQ